MSYEAIAGDKRELGREQAAEELKRFIENPALDELASLFTQEQLPDSPTERLAALQEVAKQNWDFRKGAERQAVAWDDDLLDQEGSVQWNTIFAAATKLKMVESSVPVNTAPDSLVILGGANKAPLDRLRYGLEKVDDFGLVAYLGSSRKISDVERAKTYMTIEASDRANYTFSYAPGAQTEFDLGCGAFETLLGGRVVSEDHVERDGDIWAWREYEFERNGETKTGFVLNTPLRLHPGEDRPRATTYENYGLFAKVAELDKEPDQSVVAVTTGFYVPGQHLPAVQTLTLPYGTHVETIGHDAAYTKVTRKPSQLLQETKSAIDAAVRLQESLLVSN